MDFFSLGLSPTSRKSTKILREINNNNRISLQIKQKFEQLNLTTKSFLTNELTVYTQQLQLQQQVEQADDQLIQFQNLQDAFSELYFLLDVENFTFKNVVNLQLSQLEQIYNKIQPLSNIGQVHTDLHSMYETTIELINCYMSLLLMLNLSNSLIYKTLILKNQQIYWETIHNSKRNKLIYFIQIFPIKLFGFVKDLLSKAGDLLQNKEFNDNAYRTTDTAGTEEDNAVYGYWSLFKYYSGALFNAFKNTMTSILIHEKPGMTFLAITNKASSLNWYKNSIRYLVTAPNSIVHKDIKEKLNLINIEIDKNIGMIDRLIKTNINDKFETLNSLESILQLQQQQQEPETYRISQMISTITQFDKLSYSETDKPSFITRYWPILALLIRYGPSQSVNIYNNSEEIISWIRYNGIEPIIGFVKNWLIRPINEMLNILRRDEEISITSKDSLKSDISSLESMMIEFANDNNITDITPEIIKQDVSNGDMKLIMSRYENEIRSPVKYILSGSLLRLILIQVQKGKVDGGVAINGIDKLLKSQQLVFGIVSMSPSLFITYQIYQYLTSARPIVVNGKQLNIVCLKSLNNIENLLVMINNGKDHDKNDYEGRLLIEIINLIVSSDLIIPRVLHDDWIRDLNELNNSSFDIETKLNLIRKIWNMYGHYFR
ncbi:NCA2 [[Candida] subhashii]|uniref:NCA2 n=1 Tax=[Candida] subhashii TaxID=561895 RepID=A0A8J5QP93_9ASCO|nr:NCA2 [[Candida] subhashii]KAG7664121.1 NCA2 [[Candida] subhashii]